MRITKTTLRKIFLEETLHTVQALLESDQRADRETAAALRKLLVAIENLDVSIDFLTAIMSGASAVDIAALQGVGGRKAAVHVREKRRKPRNG